MKKRIFAGLLLVFMLMLSAVPCFAEPTEEAPAEEVVVEETPAEEAPAEEAPAEEAPVEAVPVEEAPQPELSKFGTIDAFSLKEAVYDDKAGTISITYVNKTEQEQGIPWIVLDFDTTKITVTPDMQNIMDASIAGQAGIEMEDGVIILIQKAIDPGAEQTVKFDAKVVDYKDGVLPQIGLRLFVQTMSNDIDLTTAAKEDNKSELSVQTVANIFTAATGDSVFGSIWSYIKENIVLVAVGLIALILLIALIITSKKKNVANVDEFGQSSLASQPDDAYDMTEVEETEESEESEESEEDGGQEDEEV